MARGRTVDERLLVLRYNAGWTVAACARAAKTEPARVKKILADHGVPLRERTAPGDAAITAAYKRHRSIEYVAKAMGIHKTRVTGALDAAGIPHSAPGRPAFSPRPWQPGSRPGRKIAATADGVTIAEAARRLGQSRDMTRQAAERGQLRSVRDPTGRLRLDPGDVARLAAALARAGRRG